MRVRKKKKRELPSDWQAKKRMLLLCLLLLIANICVGAYLVLTWDKPSRPPTTPPTLPLQDKPSPVVVPPQSDHVGVGWCHWLRT